MNIHHLELFYHVARSGGITEAVRKIPYGIQQPAVSGQILQLEDHLGVTLFRRRPFRLTSPGEQLFAFIRPFFDGLPAVEEALRGDGQRIRLGGSGLLLRDHLPDVIQQVRRRFPKLKLSLREGHRPQLEGWLKAGELDFATTLLDSKPPAGISATPLLELPLILLVPAGSPLKSASELWAKDRIDESLVCLPPDETIPRHFQQRLGRLGVAWPPKIEVSSLVLIETYVSKGYGIGLYVSIPRYRFPSGIRALHLSEFPPVVLGALWTGRKSPVVEAFIQALQARIRSFSEIETPSSQASGGARQARP